MYLLNEYFFPPDEYPLAQYSKYSAKLVGENIRYLHKSNFRKYVDIAEVRARQLGRRDMLPLFDAARVGIKVGNYMTAGDAMLAVINSEQYKRVEKINADSTRLSVGEVAGVFTEQTEAFINDPIGEVNKGFKMVTGDRFGLGTVSVTVLAAIGIGAYIALRK